jgi:hypothetical protein
MLCPCCGWYRIPRQRVLLLLLLLLWLLLLLLLSCCINPVPAL